MLVIIVMGGGNDGLNMVVPYGEGRYYDLRRHRHRPRRRGRASTAVWACTRVCPVRSLYGAAR
ncbi:MAG: hypothetical protein R2755_34010 [Acidimicrobiales bacterium]